MLKYLKKGIAVWVIGWVCAVLLAGIAFLCFALGNEGAVTETWDLADYGRVYGVQFEHTKAVQEDFNSIFPREITPSFEDVHYHYAASDVGIGYEFNLEFTIPDEEQFRAYAASVAPPEDFTIFPYDENYLEYLPCENFLSIIDEDNFIQEDLTFDWVKQACIKRVDRSFARPSCGLTIFSTASTSTRSSLPRTTATAGNDFLSKSTCVLCHVSLHCGQICCLSFFTHDEIKDHKRIVIILNFEYIEHRTDRRKSGEI